MDNEFPVHLTKLLILDPEAGIATPEFVAAQQRDPALEGLHPLARARAMLHCDPRKLEEHLVEAALETCWLSHDADLEGEDPYQRSEEVRHSIGPCEFLSAGHSLYIRVPDDKVRSTRLSRLPLTSIARADLRSTASLVGLWRDETGHRPFCYISDSGEQLGGMSHRLVSIGGLPVDGPEIHVEYSGEEEIHGLTEEYEPAEVDDGSSLSFCWLHYLDEAQARQLGIARDRPVRSKARSSGKLPKYPDWVDPRWARRHGWIRVEDLEESYRNGEEILESLSFLVGPDSGWRPPEPAWEDEDWDEELEEDEADGAESDKDDEEDGDQNDDDDEDEVDLPAATRDLSPPPDALVAWEFRVGGALPRDLSGLLLDLQRMIELVGKRR